MTMPDDLTPDERQAIDAYDGPVTVCPPQTFSEGSEDVSWRATMGNLFNAKKREAQRRSKARRERYAELHRQGKTPREMAAILGVSETAVRRSMRRYRLKASGRSSPKTVDDHLRTIPLAGRSLVSISREVGCGDDTVRNALRRIGRYEEWKEARG